MEETKKTCLHDLHVAMGAQMTPFGGFDMPIQYEGIVESIMPCAKRVECLTCRIWVRC